MAGNRFWFYLLCIYVLRVQYSCGVVLFFWFWWEIVVGVTYVFRVQYSFLVVSVFWLWREIVLKMRTCFYKKILLGYFFYDPLADVCFFIRPNTLLLCNTLICIFLLYCTDPQVEIQIRILLKDKYGIVYTSNPTLISQKMNIQFLFFKETT
jgi:hypothetical protein